MFGVGGLTADPSHSGFPRLRFVFVWAMEHEFPLGGVLFGSRWNQFAIDQKEASESGESLKLEYQGA